MKGFRHSARSRFARATSLCALGAALVAAWPAAAAMAADAPAPTSTVVAPVPPPLPKITKLEPAVVSPIGNDLVFIIGEQLQSVTGVTVDGVPAEFFDEGDGSLSFYTPPHARGMVQVRVTSPAGTSIDNGVADDLWYVAGEGPRPDSISPTAGPASGGATLTIRGTFDGATGVYFYPQDQGGAARVSGTFELISSSEIRVEAPALTPGRYRVDVESPWAPSWGATLYYTAVAAPKITDLSPSVVFPIGDDLVFVSGEHLDTVTDVLVDGVSVEWFNEGDGTLSFYTPAKPVGSYDVRLVGPGGMSVDNGRVDDLWFAYGHGPAAESITPNQGPAVGGPWLTIRGDLRAVEAVYFLAPDGTGVLVQGTDVEYVSAREVRVKAPALPPGKYEVEAADESGFYPLDAPVYYTAVAAPQILQVSPAWGVAGVGGLTVITGKNLAGVKSVRFGSKLARRFLAVGNVILAVSPPQPRGVYPVTVTTAGGTSAQTTAGRYVYVNAGAN